MRVLYTYSPYFSPVQDIFLISVNFGTSALTQVARDCGMLPLVLSIAGALAKDKPLDPTSWRRLHEKLQDKREKFRDMEHGKLFATIDASSSSLPLSQKKQLQLMAVLPSGISANSEELSNLWDQVRV